VNRRQIANLVMRVFGLYIGYRGLADVLFSITSLFRAETRSSAFAYGVMGLVLLAAGVLVWRTADAISARALGTSSDEPEEDDRRPDALARIGALDIHAIAFTVLGVYLIVTGLERVTGGVGLWIDTTFASHTASGSRADMLAFQGSTARYQIYAAAAYLIAGVILTIGARSLAAKFRRMWWTGRGVVRANRFELIDFSEKVRAQLVVEEATLGKEDPVLSFFDESGSETTRLPARSAIPSAAPAEGTESS
jgi:hypothetical protein